MIYVILFLTSFMLLLNCRKVICKICYKKDYRFNMVRRKMSKFWPYDITILRCKDPNLYSVSEKFAPCKHEYETDY